MKQKDKDTFEDRIQCETRDEVDVADLKAITHSPETRCELNTRADFLHAMEDLKFFLGGSQRAFVMQLARGEERQFFFDKMVELANLVAGMPATYDQEGTGDAAFAYLHYFSGGCDWYITEKDKGSDDDEPKGVQHQAFGLADLGYGAELGYISIQELLDNNVELDFHFSPQSVAEIKGQPNSFDNSTSVVTDPAPLHGVGAAGLMAHGCTGNGGIPCIRVSSETRKENKHHERTGTN